MNESDFDGTLVLEGLAELDLVDAFFEAIDSDEFGKVQSIMENAKLDSKTIAMVLKMISEDSGEKGR